MAQVWTVGQINRYVKTLLERDPILKGAAVRGEISNFKAHSSGHLYFTLKDDDAVLRCVMFRTNSSRLTFRPADGMAVVLRGYVSLYERDGAFQFYAESMEADGVGALYATFERLKQRLLEEGLFEGARKRVLPLLPRRVAVITSPTGAVVRDICNVASRRFPGARILVVPVAVQGVEAAPQIVSALERVEELAEVDVVILARGGGSLEELWAFNDEKLARTIARCRLPVVSAVGHETDYTIADFVADVRAPTPSAAAELVFPLRMELDGVLTGFSEKLRLSLEMWVRQRRDRVMMLGMSGMMRNPERLLDGAQQRSGILGEQLESGIESLMRDRNRSVEVLGMRLGMLNPMAVLKRGYGLVEKQGETIVSVSELRKGDQVTVRLRDGHAQTRVENIDQSEQQ